MFLKMAPDFLVKFFIIYEKAQIYSLTNYVLTCMKYILNHPDLKEIGEVQILILHWTEHIWTCILKYALLFLEKQKVRSSAKIKNHPKLKSNPLIGFSLIWFHHCPILFLIFLLFWDSSQGHLFEFVFPYQLPWLLHVTVKNSTD